MRCFCSSRGQVASEFVASIVIILFIFMAVILMLTDLQTVMGDETLALASDITCNSIANAVNSAYAMGDGAQVYVIVGTEVFVRPGLVQIGPQDDTYFCTITMDAVNDFVNLTAGNYSVENVGGKLEFQPA